MTMLLSHLEAFPLMLTNIKVCYHVYMLLIVLMNDCVTFSGILELLWIKIDWFSLLPSCRRWLSFFLTAPALLRCISSHLQLSSSTGMLFLIELSLWLLSGSLEMFLDWNRPFDYLILSVVSSSSCLPLLLLQFIVVIIRLFIRRFFCIQPWDCLFAKQIAAAFSQLLLIYYPVFCEFWHPYRFF